MRSSNPLLDRVKTPTPRSIPSRLFEKKPLVPRQNIVKLLLGILSGKSSRRVPSFVGAYWNPCGHWLNLNFWQVLLEKLRGDTPKLCDSLIMNDVDTSAPGASDSGVGSSVTSPGEGRNGGQPTPQGKFSVAFQQVREWISRGFCAVFNYIVVYVYHHSERTRF